MPGVTPDCIDDTMYGDEPVTRCRDLIPGTYRVEVSGIPPGQIADLHCASEVFGPDDEAFYGLNYASAPFPVIDDDFWLWFCNVGTPHPNAVLSLWLPRGAVDGIATDVTPVLVGPDDLPLDVATVCTVGQVYDDGLTRFIEVECALADSGVYRLAWDGVPDEVVYDEECTTFEIADEPAAPAVCRTRAVIDQAPVAMTDPDQPVSSVVTLPDTGRSTGRAVSIAAMTLLAGALFVVVARRRPTGA